MVVFNFLNDELFIREKNQVIERNYFLQKLKLLIKNKKINGKPVVYSEIIGLPGICCYVAIATTEGIYMVKQKGKIPTWQEISSLFDKDDK